MDLPLSSNTDVVNLTHFILDLECNMELKKLYGTITLFCCFKTHNKHQSCQPKRGADFQSVSDDVTSFESSNHKLSSVHEDLIITLDSFDINISSVEEVSPSLELEHKIKAEAQTSVSDADGVFVLYSRHPGCEIQFEMSKHCVKITGLSPTQQGTCIVRIHYSTLPEGPSLKWTLDQDGKYVYNFFFF